MATAMIVKKDHNPTFLLDRSKKRSATFAALCPEVVSTVAEIRNSMAHATGNSLWISYANKLTEALVKSVKWPSSSLGYGVFIHPIDTKMIPALTSCFRRIAFATDGGFLPSDELAEVLEAENRCDLFIGGSVDRDTETITLWRGDMRPLTVPFSAFEKSGDGTEPDFDDFAVIDCGQTIRLGEYEAAVDAILYEYAPEYRRRVSKERLEDDQSFGASLRRLRKQRGLKREDFEPEITAKTVARIEQGKVNRIQKKTLHVLAERLSVDPDEIASY